MKSIIIRECAVNACSTLESNGARLLLAICKQAFDGTPIDFEEDFTYYGGHELEATYEAIAPDIIGSVTEEPSAGIVVRCSQSALEDLVEDAMAVAEACMCRCSDEDGEE